MKLNTNNKFERNTDPKDEQIKLVERHVNTFYMTDKTNLYNVIQGIVTLI